MRREVRGVCRRRWPGGGEGEVREEEEGGVRRGEEDDGGGKGLERCLMTKMLRMRESMRARRQASVHPVGG